MVAPIITAVRHLVELLVAGDYDQIAKLTNEQRLDAASIERVVREYGRKLIMPPNNAFDKLDIVQVKGSVPPRWSVRMNLWTLEEGQSDLSIEVTLIQHGNDYIVELDDIHVL
jgi:hypothetical protein